MRLSLSRLIPLGIFVVLVLFLWRGLSLNPRALPSPLLNQSIPDFHLPSLTPKEEISPSTFRGKKVLLNVFASWCSACFEEQVQLLKLSREGVAIIGINYKDAPMDAKAYLERFGNPYQIVGLDTTGKVAIELGVYGAPETFVIDEKGVVRFRYAGILTEAVWQQQIKPLLEVH